MIGDDSSLGAPPSYYSVTPSQSEDNIHRDEDSPVVERGGNNIKNKEECK
jgi:hypothetical protein